MKQIYLKKVLYWGITIVLYYFWFQAFYNSLRYDSIWPYESFSIAYPVILNNFLTIAIIFIFNILLVFHIVKIKTMRNKVIIDILLSFSWLILINWIYLLINGLYRDVTVDWTGTFLNNILILLGVELIYYSQNYNRTRIEIEKSARKTLQYKYDALRAQINPHFLFNSLNLLSSLVSLDQEKSKKFILGLARMYRYILECEGKEKTSVKEEFDFLSAYIEVLEMRYNNKFRVKIDGIPVEKNMIIPYTLQLLIENVTKHNVISSKNPMEVTISINKEGINVKNPVTLKPNNESGGIGLKYLGELYKIYGKNFSTQREGGFFHAYIPYL